jgi:hypothetical protein
MRMKNKCLFSLPFLVLVTTIVNAKDFQVDANELWTEIVPESNEEIKPKCANGDDYSFFYKESQTKSKDLMVFFNGGGACWGFDSCSSLDNTKYPINTFEETANLKYNKPGHWKGLLDFQNAKNPVKNWNVLVLPYCTGDLHAGNKTNTYQQDEKSITIHHRGQDNVRAALRWMKKNKHDTYHTLLVAGSSSGGYGAMFNYDLIKKHIRGKNRVVAIDAADGVVTKDFEESIFSKQGNPWGFNNNRSYSSHNFITHFNNGVVRRNNDTQFISYSTSWDVMQILFFNIMKNKPDAWLKFDDVTRNEWKKRAESNRNVLLKNRNFHMYLDNGCNHSGFRYDDSFYDSSTSDQPILYEWIKEATQKRSIRSIGLENVSTDPKPSENSFGGCINRAVQSVQR